MLSIDANRNGTDTIGSEHRLTNNSSHGKVVNSAFSHEDLVDRRLSD